MIRRWIAAMALALISSATLAAQEATVRFSTGTTEI